MDLRGWEANDRPESFTVEDGLLKSHGKNGMSHLFVVDNAGQDVAFKDFELVVIARSEPNSNSGIFFPTDRELRGGKYLNKGYEVQLNSSPKEKRKTGSLYGVVDLDSSPVDETSWLEIRLRVDGKRIQVFVDPNTRATIAASFFRVCRGTSSRFVPLPRPLVSLSFVLPRCCIPAIFEKAKARKSMLHASLLPAIREMGQRFIATIVQNLDRIRKSRRTECISNPGGACIIDFEKCRLPRLNSDGCSGTSHELGEIRRTTRPGRLSNPEGRPTRSR